MNSTTPGGRLILHVIGALGQFESDLIRELRAMIEQGVNAGEAVARLKAGKTTPYSALASSALT
jgi:DNA invertase Pin-like site-specific DNA recombinase